MYFREESTAPNAAVPSSDGVVSAHLRCVTCQYDLFGSRHDGLCPECGTPVEMTQNAVSWMSSLDGRGQVRRIAAIQLVGVVLLGATVLAGMWTLSAIPFAVRGAATAGVLQCATFTALAIAVVASWCSVPGRVQNILDARLPARARWWPVAEVGAAIGALAFVGLFWVVLAQANHWIRLNPNRSMAELLLFAVLVTPFFLLGFTSCRHLFSYEANAILLDDAGRPWLRAASRCMAWLRFSFELIWLAGCTAGTILGWYLGERLRWPELTRFADALALGSYIGLFASIGVWAVTLAYHLCFAIALRR